MDVWYTDKKKGICHGEIIAHGEDYCGRGQSLIDQQWIFDDRLFQSEKELRETIDRIVNRTRWTDLDDLGRTSSGHTIIRSSHRRDWLIPIIEQVGHFSCCDCKFFTYLKGCYVRPFEIKKEKVGDILSFSIENNMSLCKFFQPIF